jgi:hypothetical protein
MSGSNMYFNGVWKASTYTANGTFVVPAKVRMVIVEMYGGGGGGAHSSTGYPYGGGRGEYVSRAILVTPGDSISIVIGAGGAGGSSDAVGSNGTDSSFDGAYYARGGKGGAIQVGLAAYNPLKEYGVGEGGNVGAGGSNSAGAGGGQGGFGNGGNASSSGNGANGGVGAGGGGSDFGAASGGTGGAGLTSLIVHRVL